MAILDPWFEIKSQTCVRLIDYLMHYCEDTVPRTVTKIQPATAGSKRSDLSKCSECSEPLVLRGPMVMHIHNLPRVLYRQTGQKSVPNYAENTSKVLTIKIQLSSFFVGFFVGF